MNKSGSKLIKFISSCVFVTTMISIPILVLNPNEFVTANSLKSQVNSINNWKDYSIFEKNSSSNTEISKIRWDDLSNNYNIQVWEEKPKNGDGTERVWDPSSNSCQIKYNIGKYPIDATNNLISVDKQLDNTTDSIIATTGNKTIQEVGFNKSDTDPDNQNQHYGIGGIDLRTKSNQNQEFPIIEIRRDAIFPDNKMDLVRANSSMDLNLDLKINLLYDNENDPYIDDDKNNGLVTLKFHFDGRQLDPAKPTQGVEQIYEIGTIPYGLNINTIKVNPLKINVHKLYANSVNQTFKMEFNPFLLKVRLDYEKLSINIVDKDGNIFNQEDLRYFIDKNENDSLPVNFNPSLWKANVRINNARYQIQPSQSVNNEPSLMQISDKPYEMYAPVDKSILDGSNEQNQKGMMTQEQWERGNKVNILEPIEHTIYAPFEISFKPEIINNEVQQILYVNENGSGWKMVSADSASGIQKYSSYNAYMDAIKNKQFGDMTFEIQVRENAAKSRAGDSNFKRIVYYRKFKLNINSAQMEFKLHGWEDINEFDKRKYLAKTMEELEKPIGYDSKAIGSGSNTNKNKPNPNYRSYLDPDTGMYIPQIAWVNERCSNGFLLDPFDKYGNKIDIEKDDDLLTPGYIAELNAPAIYSVDLTESSVEAGIVNQITNISYESTKVLTKNEYKLIDGSRCQFTYRNEGVRYFHPLKVGFINMKPLNFDEYILNVRPWTYDENYKKITEAINNLTPLPKLHHFTLNSLLEEYLEVGGYPQVVNTFIENREYDKEWKCKDLMKENMIEINSVFKKWIMELTDNYNQNAKCLKVYQNLYKSMDEPRIKVNKIVEGSRLIKYNLCLYILSEVGITMIAYNNKLFNPNEDFDIHKYQMYYNDHSLLRINFEENNLDNKPLSKKSLIKNYLFCQMLTDSYTNNRFDYGYFYYKPNNNEESKSYGNDYLIDVIYKINGYYIPCLLCLKNHKYKTNFKEFNAYAKFRNNGNKFLKIVFSFENLKYGKENKILYLPLYLACYLDNIIKDRILKLFQEEDKEEEINKLDSNQENQITTNNNY